MVNAAASPPQAAAAVAAGSALVVAQASDRTATSTADDLLDSIAKRLDILIEMARRDAERAKRCRGCGGTSDYMAVYDGEYVAIHNDKAYVCERCMEDTVSRENGMDVYVWKHDLVKLTCVRCGDDVTSRGWCVCPRNAELARKAKSGGGA